MQNPRTPVRHHAFAIVAFALLLVAPGRARAQATLLNGLGGPLGYGTSCEYANDDGSSPSIDLSPAFPRGLRFFGQTHTTAYVNNNGNMTFNGSLFTYTPRAFPVSDQPMIAPYWADVDTRGQGCTAGTTGTCTDPTENGVWWQLEPGRMVVTWDRVGYFSCATDHRMTFQMILTDAQGCGAEGDFDIEFRYNRCEWIAGGASGGTDGQCPAGSTGCTPAQAGFDAGDLVHFYALPGSLTNDIAHDLCNGSNVGNNGYWHFQIRSGALSDAGACTPVPPVDAGPCLTRECLLIEGRAGPLGGCGCSTMSPARGATAPWMFALATAGGIATVRRRRARRA